jgi:hypothetical protein
MDLASLNLQIDIIQSLDTWKFFRNVFHYQNIVRQDGILLSLLKNGRENPPIVFLVILPGIQ